MAKKNNDLAKELPHVYRPSPSKVLLQRGVVVEDSYYLVEQGEIVFENGSTLACTFEIAYMQDASAWAVAYVTVKSTEAALRFDQKYDFDKANKLKGNESVWGRMVEAEIDFSKAQTGLPEFGGVRIVFRVSRYEISYDYPDFDSKTAYFHLVNLPLHGSYSPTHSAQYDRLDAIEKLGQVRLEAGINALLGSPADQSAEEKRAAAYQAAEDARKEFQDNAGYLTWRYIPLNLNKEELGRLFWSKGSDDLAYPLQITSVLRLKIDKIPEDWSPEAVASWLCALLSIALGYDIKWLRWTKSSPSDGLRPVYEIWSANTVGLQQFHAFAEKPYDALLVKNSGLSENRYENTFNFVMSTLGRLFDQGLDKFVEYYNLIYHYILYAATPSPSAYIRYTLLSVMAEEIYNTWTRVEGKNYTDSEPQDRRDRRSNLKQAARKGIDDVLCLLYPPQQGETPELYRTHLSKRRKYIKQQIDGSFSSTLDQRLLWFIGESGFEQVDRINVQITLFVESRRASLIITNFTVKNYET